MSSGPEWLIFLVPIAILFAVAVRCLEAGHYVSALIPFIASAYLLYKGYKHNYG